MFPPFSTTATIPFSFALVPSPEFGPKSEPDPVSPRTPLLFGVRDQPDHTFCGVNIVKTTSTAEFFTPQRRRNPNLHLSLAAPSPKFKTDKKKKEKGEPPDATAVPKFRRIEDLKSDNVSKILKRFSSFSLSLLLSPFSLLFLLFARIVHVPSFYFIGLMSGAWIRLRYYPYLCHGGGSSPRVISGFCS